MCKTNIKNHSKKTKFRGKLSPAQRARDTLIKRAGKKYQGSALSVGLANLGSDLTKSYWNTFHCASVYIKTNNGKFRPSYCGNRWCQLCSNIRTAKAINKYYPILKTWKNAQFVTLTKITVSEEYLLSGAIGDMLDGFNAVKRRMRKNGYTVKAIRKLECTKSHMKGQFHPHYHLIVEGKEEAEVMRRYWFEYWTKKGVKIDWKAQDVRPADKNSLKELFKYFTKILISKKDSPGGRRMSDLKDLDVIFRAMKCKQVWRPIGFTVSGADENKAIEADLKADSEIDKILSSCDYTLKWIWDQVATDWISEQTGECLTGYKPAESLRKIIESIAPAELMAGNSHEAVERVQKAFRYQEKAELRRFFDLADNPPDRETFDYIYSMSFNGLLKACEDVIRDNQERGFNPPASELKQVFGASMEELGVKTIKQQLEELEVKTIKQQLAELRE